MATETKDYLPVRTVNRAGLLAIHDWLGEYHKRGRDHFTPAMLNAWAADAERDEGVIEIKSWESVSGHTECLHLRPEHFDTEWVPAE